MGSNAAVLRKPVIIIGAPRSGTTYLFNVLAAHPGLTGFDEPRMVWRYGNDRKSDLLLRSDARSDVVSHIRRHFAREARHRDGLRILEKSPANSLRVQFVDQVFPDAKFVVIYRNGVDASLSSRYRWLHRADNMDGRAKERARQRLKELGPARVPYYAPEIMRRLAPERLRAFLGHNVWGPRIPGVRELMRELNALEVAALQWRMCVELTRHDLRTLPSSRYIEVRLESLSRDVLASILTFAEIEHNEPVLAEFDRTFTPTFADQTELSSMDAELLRRWLEPTMEWLGYSF